MHAYLTILHALDRMTLYDRSLGGPLFFFFSGLAASSSPFSPSFFLFLTEVFFGAGFSSSSFSSSPASSAAPASFLAAAFRPCFGCSSALSSETSGLDATAFFARAETRVGAVAGLVGFFSFAGFLVCLAGFALFQ